MAAPRSTAWQGLQSPLSSVSPSGKKNHRNYEGVAPSSTWRSRSVQCKGWTIVAKRRCFQTSWCIIDQQAQLLAIYHHVPAKITPPTGCSHQGLSTSGKMKDSSDGQLWTPQWPSWTFLEVHFGLKCFHQIFLSVVGVMPASPSLLCSHLIVSQAFPLISSAMSNSCLGICFLKDLD